MARHASLHSGLTSSSSGNRVYLNVYDLNENNAVWYPWGLGLYHSGVQLGREEYTFASSAGIFTHDPKSAPGAKFRETIDMGVFKGTSKDLETILSALRPYFKGTDYHVLNKNCNTFANELVTRLVGHGIPAYVNRMAYYGSFFSCLLPDTAANDAPVDSGNNRGSQSYNYNPVRTQPPPESKPAFASNSGRKLGGISSSDSNDGGIQERRMKLLAAANNRGNT